MPESVAIIGPICAGKTTLCDALGEILSLKVLHLDIIKTKYLDKKFFSRQSAVILNKYGLKKFFLAQASAEAKFLKHFIQQPAQQGIYDFGAGMLWALKDDDLSNIMNAFDEVFLILPSLHKDRCLKIIYKRLKERLFSDPEIMKYTFDEEFNLVENLLDFYWRFQQIFSCKIVETRISLSKSVFNFIECLELESRVFAKEKILKT